MAPGDAATTSQSNAAHPVGARAMDFRRAGTPPRVVIDAPPFWGEDGFTFGDLLDLVNPLQHIPLIGSLYRSLTGDEIAFGPRVLGGALFAGGPIGAAAAVAANTADAVIAQRTGRDLGGHLLAQLGLGEDEHEEGAPPASAGASLPVELAEVSGPLWLPQPAPEATRASEPAPPARLEARPRPRAGVAEAEPAPELTPAQWQALTASLEPEPARSDSRSPASAGAGLAGAGVALAMARALDKYESLTRDRARIVLVE